MGISDYFVCVEEYGSGELLGLGIVNLISSFLSLMGSSFVVVHFLLYSRRLVLSQLIFFLAVSDLGSSFFIAFSQAWLLVKEDYSWSTCLALRSFIEFFVVSSFFWSSCIAFYLFFAIIWNKDMFLAEGSKKSGRYHSGTRTFLLVSHVLCWGVPLVLCIILLAADWYTKAEGGWCHPDEPYQFMFWELPMILTFVFNIVLYGIIAVSLQRNRRRSGGLRGHISSKIQSRLALFLLVYVVCWAPNLFSHVETYIWPDCWMYWLGFLQNALSPAQGFLNCVVYGLSNKQVSSKFRWYDLILQIIAAPLLVLPVSLFTICGPVAKGLFPRCYEAMDSCVCLKGIYKGSVQELGEGNEGSHLTANEQSME